MEVRGILPFGVPKGIHNAEVGPSRFFGAQRHLHRILPSYAGIRGIGLVLPSLSALYPYLFLRPDPRVSGPTAILQLGSEPTRPATFSRR